MTEQQDYAVTQHDSCCELLGLNSANDAAVPTLWDAIRDLIARNQTLKTELEAAACLHDAVKQGIATTPDRTLTDDVLAAFRMPIPLSRAGHMLKGWPPKTSCTQRGDWFLIVKGASGS